MKKLLLSVMLALCLPFAALAQDDTREMYSVYTEADSTLTFYYDNQKDSRVGAVYGNNYYSPWEGNHPELSGYYVKVPEWCAVHTKTTKAVFDASFVDARPTTTDFWFSEFNKLRQIVGMEFLNTESVTSMRGMFAACDQLESIDLSHFNTQKVTSMNSMFASCCSLTSIDVSSFNTESVTDMSGLFLSCNHLTEIDLSHFDTSSVTDMSTMFGGCESLTSLDLSNFDTSNVVDMGEIEFYYPDYGGGGIFYKSGLFMNCKSLTSVNLSSFDTKNVTSMNYMFSGCESLASIDLSHFDTQKVTAMEGMFANCKALTQLDLSSFNTENVTSFNGMFYNCNQIESLDLSNFDTHNATSFGNDGIDNYDNGMFCGCSNLKTLDISNFDTSNAIRMAWMFHECKSLTGLDLSYFDTSKVTDMHYMFGGCASLNRLDISNFDTSNTESIHGMFAQCYQLSTIYCSHDWSVNDKITDSEDLFINCIELVGGAGTAYTFDVKDKAYARPDTPETPGYFTVKEPEMYAVYTEADSTLTFYYDNQKGSREGEAYELNTRYNQPAWKQKLSGTKKVIFDESFADARPTSTYDWFEGGGNWLQWPLKEIEGIEYLNTSSVTNMANMFSCCNNLTSLDLSNFDTSNVTDMGGMFYCCEKLSTVDVSSFNTEKVTDMGAMFEHCHMLSSLDVSNFNTANVERMSDMFWNCGWLTTLDLSNFNTENVTSMNGMFAYCYSLTELKIDNFDTWRVTDMKEMFAGCNNLSQIDLSHFCTLQVKDMGSMFQDSRWLQTVDLSSFCMKNVTNISSMFENCPNLQTIYASDNWADCEGIENDNNLFTGCTSLVGGMGTTYNEDNTDISYARVDDLDGHGYFTYKAFCGPSASFALYTEDDQTLSFYHTNTIEKDGEIFDLKREYNYPVWMWNDIKNSIQTVVFDESFKSVKPDNTSFWLSGMGNLTQIEGLENLDTENVTDMTEMFSGCSNLTSMDLSTFNTSNVTTTNSMFADCTSLTTIYCNDDWSKNEAVSSSNWMFGNCDQLVGGAGTAHDSNHTDIAYARPDSPETPGYFTSVSKMYSVFNEESATLAFYYDTSKNSREGTVYGMTYDEQGYPEWNACKTDVQKVVFDSSFAEARPESTSEWFSGFSSLLQIEGLENLNTENVTNMRGMFRSCWRLTEIDLSHFNTSNVTNMTSMFYNCQSLISLDLSSFDTHNVTSMASMFIACKNLEYVDVSSFDTKNVTVMMWMFSDCNSLKELDLSSFDTQNVDDIQGMFIGCKSLTSLSLANFNTENATKMVSMFSGCENLVSLDLSGFNTRSARHLSSMFMGCKSLQNLDLSHFDTSNISWFYSMFEGCESLKSLNINSFVFKDGSYRDGMFTSVPSDCVLYLPKGMTVSDFEGYEQGDLVHDAQTNIVETNEDGTATCEELVMADDDYFMVRTPFEAKKAVFRFHLNNEEQPAGMPRRINEQVPDGHRVPIYIPFAFDSKKFGQVYQMGTLTDDKTAVQFDELQEPTTEANRPYIINSNGDDIVAENVMVEVSERMEATGADEMLGVIEQTLVPMGGYWFDAANDKLLLAGEDEEVSVLAGRGYFLLPSAVGAASLDALFGPQIATAVASTPNSHQPTLIYDLQGRRLSPADAHSAKPRIAIVRMSDGTTRKTVRR